MQCLKEYKDLGRLIEDEFYFVPEAIDNTAFKTAKEEDPDGINKARLIKAHENRDKEILKMKHDRPGMYGYILSKLSKESEDEIARHKNYVDFNRKKDPLELWKAIKDTHMVSTASKVEAIIKKTARSSYQKCQQGEFESRHGCGTW